MQSLTAGGIIEDSNSLSDSCSLNTTVAIDELSIENEITIFPNPFTNKIFTSNPANGVVYSLKNIMGQIIWSGKNTSSQGFSNLENGVYFLIIDRETKVQTSKIIKRH